MSMIQENAVTNREVTHFVLASLSDCDRFLYSFFVLSFSVPIFIYVDLDIDKD